MVDCAWSAAPDGAVCSNLMGYFKAPHCGDVIIGINAPDGAACRQVNGDIMIKFNAPDGAVILNYLGSNG